MASRVSAHEAGPTRLAFAPHGKEVLTGGSDAKVNAFEFGLVINSSRPVRSYAGNSEQITCIEFDPQKGDGSRFAVGAQDGIVVLYEGDASRQIFRQAACMVHACPFSPCGKHVAVASDNGLRVISTAEGCTSTIQIPAPLESGEAVLAATWLPSNVLVACGTSDVMAWDMSSGTPVNKKFPKPYGLTQLRQRNETVALKLPYINVFGNASFVLPRGKALMVQPIGGSAVTLTVPDLPAGHEVLLVEASPELEVVGCLDDVGYLTFFHMRTRKPLSHMRPILGTDAEEICDFAFHPTQPGTIITTTSGGMLHLLAGVFELPLEQPKKQIKAKKEEADVGGGDGDEEMSGDDGEASLQRHHLEEDEAEEVEDDDDDDDDDVVDLNNPASEGEDEMEMDRHDDDDDMSNHDLAVPIRPTQAPFQVGQAPPPGHPGVEGTRVLCWNRIGMVRSVSSTDVSAAAAATLSISFYDKATYSAVRFTDKSDYAPLTMAALGRRGCVFASNSQEDPNRVLYRALQSWGTNTEWTRVLDTEVPACVAVGDTWVACFTDRYLRLFSHTGLNLFVVSLPHRVVCCTGLDSGRAPSCGDIPLKHDIASLLAFVCDDGTPSLKVSVWDVPNQKVVDDNVPLALSGPHTSLVWLGWTDEGMLATQDSDQVLRVMTHLFGRQWVPVFDPKASRTFERLHVLSIRGQQVTAIPVPTGVSPDPRIDDHQQVTRPLLIPTASLPQWRDKESAVVHSRVVLHEKKHRAEHYTADIAKLELKQDTATMALFKESVSGRQASTARALDLSRRFNLKDRLEKAMEHAYDKKEKQLYEKMRLLAEEFGPKRTRKCRLPNKPKAAKGATVDERIESLARREEALEEAVKQMHKQIAAGPPRDAAVAERKKPVKEAAKAAPAAPQQPQQPAPAPFAALQTSSFFSAAPTTAEEPSDVQGGLRLVAQERAAPPAPPAPAPEPIVLSATPAVPKKRKAPDVAAATPVASKKARKPATKPAAAPRAPQAPPPPPPQQQQQQAEADQWWDVDGRHVDQLSQQSPTPTGLIHTTQVEQSAAKGGAAPAAAAAPKPLVSPFAKAPDSGPSQTSQAFSAASTQHSDVKPFAPLPSQKAAPAPAKPEQKPAPQQKEAKPAPAKPEEKPAPPPPAAAKPGGPPKNDGMAKLQAMMRKKKSAQPPAAPPVAAPAVPPPVPVPAPAPAKVADPTPKYADGSLKEDVAVPERATSGLAAKAQVSSDLSRAKEMIKQMEADEEEDGDDDNDVGAVGMPAITISK